MKTKQGKPVISAEGARKFTKTLNIAFSLILEACLSTARIRIFGFIYLVWLPIHIFGLVTVYIFGLATLLYIWFGYHLYIWFGYHPARRLDKRSETSIHNYP